MPSRAYTSFLRGKSNAVNYSETLWCQCPLWLIPHFYGAANGTSYYKEEWCQCPLWLIPHFYLLSDPRNWNECRCVNALSGLYLISTTSNLSSGTRDSSVSMPSLAYTSFLPAPMFQPCVWLGHDVSMPSLAYTSFLRYPFKNLGFMRFPEPVFAGIYQNILTTAVFRAC